MQDNKERLYFIQVKSQKITVHKVFPTTDVSYAGYLMGKVVVGDTACGPEYAPNNLYITKLDTFVRRALNGELSVNEIHGVNKPNSIRTLVRIDTGNLTHVYGVDTVDLRHAILAAFSSLYTITRPVSESDLPDLKGSLLGAFGTMLTRPPKVFEKSLSTLLTVMYSDGHKTIYDVAVAMAHYMTKGIPGLSVYARRADYETFHKVADQAPLDLFTSNFMYRTPKIEIERTPCDASVEHVKLFDVYVQLSDFGRLANVGSSTQEVCGNVMFTPRPMSYSVLRKYNITQTQYEEIVKEMTKELSTGTCDKCKNAKFV